jgi:Reverse transcriptase (RNA-dependent DNA polymerase)
LCSPDDFRKFIAGGDAAFPSLIQKNTSNIGIPQGTPISDILANVYLVDFDKKLARWVRKFNGKYFRYCDDIIVIIPRKAKKDFSFVKSHIVKSIEKEYSELKIKEEKVAVGRFLKIGEKQIYTQIVGSASFNGIEYLGFQYDGEAVQIKNSTMSNAWRKLKRRSYGWAKRYVKRYRAKGDQWLLTNAPLENKVTEVIKSVNGVNASDYSELTFRKYAGRAQKVFCSFETKFASQVKRYKRLAKRQFELALQNAVSKYGFDAFVKKGGKL